MKKLLSIMLNLQIHYHFKLNFQKVDIHTRHKCIIHDTKYLKYNQLQSLKLVYIIFE